MPVQTPQQKSAELVASQAPIARWTPTASALTRTLAAWENHLEITIGSGMAAVLTIPDVEAAAGQTYIIRCAGTFAGGATVVINFPDNPLVLDGGAIAELASAWGDAGQDLTADGDYLVMYSNGVMWTVLMNRTT